LFLEEVKCMYDVEKKIVKSLPEVIDAATNEKLKDGLRNHLEETKEQVNRLEQVASELKEDITGSVCEAMNGLIDDMKKIIDQKYQPDVTDAAIISYAQRIEHFEIAIYGGLIAFAKQLKLSKVEDLFKKSEKEEANADKELTKIAEGSKGVNKRACCE